MDCQEAEQNGSTPEVAEFETKYVFIRNAQKQWGRICHNHEFAKKNGARIAFFCKMWYDTNTYKCPCA